ncbi:MAG: FRG domain-containing protein, partial [Desulfobacterales bacterium]
KKIPTCENFNPLEAGCLLCRNAAFEEAIGEHPYVRVAEKTLFLDNPLHIDKQGIAQHYGLCTDRIDLTSNFDVASFFATCKWDKEQNRFMPIKSSSKLGVIYRVLHVFMMKNTQTKEGESAFSFVGWQPLPRPEQQRACSLCMQKGEDFIHIPTVQRYYFQHDGAISERIWNEFEQGKTLFPEDKAAILANKAETLMGFTRDQIDRAWSKLEFWNCMKYEDNTRYRIESRTSIELVKRSQLDWEDVGLEKDQNYWLQKLKKNLTRVRFRKCHAG